MYNADKCLLILLYNSLEVCEQILTGVQLSRHTINFVKRSRTSDINMCV